MKTKIICTLGPRTNSLNVLMSLKNSGMSCVRINTAHGDFSQYQKFVGYAKKVGVPVILDLKGPDLRIKLNEPLNVKKGERIKIFKDKFPHFNYDILGDVKKGDLVFFDNGLIKSVVKEKSKDFLVLEFSEDAVILENKGVNIPDRELKVPNLSVKDFEGIDFANKNNVDFLALSFVRNKEDVLRLKKKSDSFIISKIENSEGLKNIVEIIDVSDAVMIARGDLAVEIGKEHVPFAQKKIIDLCNERGVPCIVATQMFESMISSREPTRAEVSDVANAVMDGSDAVMLSGETAIGKHPVLVVKEMASVLKEADKHTSLKFFDAKNDSESLIISAVSLISSLNISKVVCLTHSGYTANMISRHRSNTTIVALSHSKKVNSLLKLSRGVNSFILPKNKTGSANSILKELKRINVLSEKDKILLLRNKKDSSKKIMNAIELYDFRDV
jgi:pyruvate kinase